MLFFRINTTLSVLEGPACLGDGRVLKRTVHHGANFGNYHATI